MNDEILSLEQAAMERWRNGDPWGFIELSADDISYFDPGRCKPIIGMDEFRPYMQQLEGKIHYQKSEFIDPKVVMIGEAALLSFNYRSTQLDQEGSVTGQTPWNATEVYFHRDGQWKIVHTHWSFLRHKVPDKVEIPVPVLSTQVQYEGVLAELMRLESAAMERWRKGDPWGFVELYDPQITYFDTGTTRRINGKEAMVAEYKKREGKIFYDVMDFIEPHVHVCGDMAVLLYRFLSTTLTTDGSILQRIPWNCTEVFARGDGNWKIIHNHWSHIRGERY